jgi:hypothetical protein
MSPAVSSGSPTERRAAFQSERELGEMTSERKALDVSERARRSPGERWVEI